MLRIVGLSLLLSVAFGVSWRDDQGIRVSEMSGTELRQVFNDWKNEFGKTYSSESQENEHFLTFIDNWKLIIDWNNNPTDDYRLGMNQFSDLTTEQFRLEVHGHTGSCLKNTPSDAFRRHLSSSSESQATAGKVSANPASVDWSAKGVVTPVKNQGQCGSCWAFSTTGSIECRSAIKTGKLVSLSEQQLVDCSRSYGNMGCNGGLMDDAFKYVKANGGLCTEAAYPYTARDGTCKKTCTAEDPISGYTDVTHDSAADLETAAAAGCVSVAIEADQTAFQFYRSGILSGRCGTRLDHGVLVVGYGSEGSKKYWKVKNSWGKTWGEQGYVRICKECGKDVGRGECGILEQPSYPIAG
jgi:cathepsin L